MTCSVSTLFKLGACLVARSGVNEYLLSDVDLQIATEGDADCVRIGQRQPSALLVAFLRKDFTLPQLFACLVVKDHLKRSYRGVEALLRDSRRLAGGHRPD